MINQLEIENKIEALDDLVLALKTTADTDAFHSLSNSEKVIHKKKISDALIQKADLQRQLRSF